MDPTERLLAAASELMYQRGYEAVGVAELCDRAGVKKGSFYHWFPSKAALAVAMLDADWQRTRRHLFEPSFDPAAPPPGAVRPVRRLAVGPQPPGPGSGGRHVGLPVRQLRRRAVHP